MAGKKISQLDAATVVTGSDNSVVVQGGVSKKVALSVLLTYMLSTTSMAEFIRDTSAAMFTDGGGITWTVNDGADTVTPAVAITASQVTDFSTAADARITAQKGFAGGLAPLDGGGKIATTYLPALAITTVQTAVSQVAQLALTTQEGDVVVRSDQNKSYIKNAGTAGDMTDFNELLTPTDTVLSVNGATGAVTLTTSDITEGSNLYYTNERVDDRVGALFVNGGGITWTYDDGAGTMTAAVSITLSAVTDAGTMAAEDTTDYYDKTAADAQFDAKAVAINTQVVDYTLVLADASKYVRMNKATGIALTVPLNATVAFPLGTKIYVRQVGAGQVTITATGGVTINTPETLLLAKQNAAATLIKVATNEWDLEGNLEAV